VSKKRADKNRKRQRRKAEQRSHLRSVPPSGKPDLLDAIDEALRDPHPLALVSMVGALYSLTDPRLDNPFDRPAEARVDRETLVESFLEIDNRRTTAALHVLAALVDDELTEVRILEELATRRYPMPDWLPRLRETEVHTIVEMVHVLGDGDDILLGMRFPGGAEATALVYIDHNLGGVTKDAFVIEAPITAVLATTRDRIADPDTTYRDLAPADARTRITDGIDWGARTYPPLESDTWPACRPLVEWLVRQLPAGGRGYERPEWSDADLARLTQEYFTSEYGAGFDDADGRGLLDSILWFGTDYGPGDPLRWSPVGVEILLADWIPRKIVADPAYLSKAPELLRSFIRYCHDRQGIRTALTDETLAAVDQWEPEYQRLIRSSRPQGAAAIAAAVQLAAADLADDDDDAWDDAWYEKTVLESLDEAVGGRHALMNLDGSALPDEEFVWAGVPGDVRSRVEEVLLLTDACCDKLFDAEYRTACRRFLSRVTVGDPNIFRRKGRASSAAAAVCWVIAKANNAVGAYGSGLTVQELMAFFGESGSSQRAGTFLRAAGIDTDPYRGMHLGTPDLLVSARRSQIITSRDRHLDAGR